MTRKPGTALVVGAVAMCLLLGVGMAQAQTVEKDGDTVTAIRGLQHGVHIYDVEFRTESAEQVYGFSDELGSATPDFTNQADALAAVLVVNNILEAEGASTVGAPGSEPSLEFNIGYEFVTEDDNVGGADVTFVHVESGRTGANPPPAWEALDPVWYHIYETHTWADFIIVDNAGDGNLSPTADANGQYTGTIGAEVAFDSRGSFDPDGTIATYDWDFGDGTFGSGETPTHTYTAPGAYIVTLTVTDDSGVPDSDFTIALIATSERPVADPNGPYVASTGDAVTFDSTGSSDPDGDDANLVYEWDFGDDSLISNEENPSHTYDTAGVYIVTLTVTDDSGASDSTRTEAAIAFGTLPPLAEAGPAFVGVEGMEVEFDGRLSRALNEGGSIVSYEWRFGDGATGSGETPSHTYAVADAYHVILTVIDNEGKTDSDHTLATIIEADTPVDLTGDVQDQAGTPLCALVLASGQFDFSCNPNGPFSLLDLPTESDGTVTRQVYVDGFFPNVETLTGSTDETVVMTRANNCPDYNSFPQPGVFPGSAGKRIDISGTILQQNTQTPVCAIVLANGQFMFSCDGTGSYNLNIPLDGNGQYNLQVYAAGFAPLVQAFDEFSPTVEVRLARATECQ